MMRIAQIFAPAASFLAFVVLAGGVGSGQALRAVAFPGSPFGVGMVEVSLSAADAGRIALHAVSIDDPSGRALYPAVETIGGQTGPVGQFLGIDGGPVRGVRVFFLLKGSDPLRFNLLTPTKHEVVVEIASQPAAVDRRGDRALRRSQRDAERKLDQWWRAYNASLAEARDRSDYPPLPQIYLSNMLGSRLGLEVPLLLRRKLIDEEPAPPKKSLDLILGVESLRFATMRQTLLGGVTQEAADQPPPPPIPWIEPVIHLPADAPAAVEPIAGKVPDECFYARFGRFNNYLWMNHLLEDYGGDLTAMATLRANDPHLNEKTQTQLGLKQSALAEVFGEQVIQDAALIGRDLFMQEGPAIGILFHAKNSAMLQNDLTGQRRRAADRLKDLGPTITVEEIAGQKVSFASTPDNTLRSFYAIDGDFHLVTTSRAIAEAFLKCSPERGSLAASPEFQAARLRYPLERDDTVFIFLSSQFFQELLSPQYRIELRRRLQAATDLELVALARLAAVAEGKPATSIEQLIEGELLPRGFGRRPDGSGPVLTAEGAFDSRRGRRGTFTPVADVPVEAVTAAERQAYAEVTQYHAQAWPEMDPLVAAIRRFKLNGTGLERVVLDAEISPFNAESYGFVATMLGPPLTTQVSGVNTDIIAGQAVVQGGKIFPSLGATHLYAGMQDTAPVNDPRGGSLLDWFRFLKSTPNYFGAFPKPGILDMLPLVLAPRVDAHGYARLLFGLWRRDHNGFTTFSFHWPLLNWVTPQLHMEQTANPAQVRLRAGDLSQARIASQAHAVSYQRARQASFGNARLMNLMTQQFHTPPADAKAIAERLLAVDLTCPLGGEYQLDEREGEGPYWVSDAWARDATDTGYRIPSDYQAPLLAWFRGGQADLLSQNDTLRAHVELDIQRTERTPAEVENPLLNWLKGAKESDEGDAEEIETPEGIPAEGERPKPEKPGWKFELPKLF